MKNSFDLEHIEWEPVTQQFDEFWKPEKEGDTFIAKIRGSRMMKNDDVVFVLEQTTGARVAVGHEMLVNELRKCEKEDIVRITFVGKKESAKRKKPYYLYHVDRARISEAFK